MPACSSAIDSRRLCHEFEEAGAHHDDRNWCLWVSNRPPRPQGRSSPVPGLTDGYSLNLTAANRVFIVEPQWNPSVENQAIARALRLGQGQSVLVTRYVVNRTVEQVSQNNQQ